MTQESTRFSSNDLDFAHCVRGPLAVLQDICRNSEPPENLADYVNGLRHHLYVAGESARRKLAAAQKKMKLPSQSVAVREGEESCMVNPVLCGRLKNTSSFQLRSFSWTPARVTTC